MKVGRIVQEPIGPARVNEQFTIDFLKDRSLAAKSFGDHPLVQVEIQVDVPWKLAEEEPD